ncbi:MAG: cupin domain-containing protein [Patescibacteria group bacterium]
MASIEIKSLNSPDQTTSPFEKGKIETVTVAGITLLRETLQPGWKWSEHVKPVVKTASCQKRHLKYIVSGRQKIVMDDGTEVELVAGDFAVIEPGHDAWVVGDEPNVLLEMVAIENHAK